MAIAESEHIAIVKANDNTASRMSCSPSSRIGDVQTGYLLERPYFLRFLRLPILLSGFSFGRGGRLLQTVQIRSSFTLFYLRLYVTRSDRGTLPAHRHLRWNGAISTLLESAAAAFSNAIKLI
jgi:hypothetical protein